MSDNRSTRSARKGDLQGAAPEPRRGGPPPLAWLIIGLLVVIGVIAWLTADRGTAPVTGDVSAPVDLPAGSARVDPAALPAPAPVTP